MYWTVEGLPVTVVVTALVVAATAFLLLKKQFHVKSPPLSAKHSRIILEEQDTICGMQAYSAGTDVSFTICIRDIYGNPLQKEDTLDDTEDDKVEVQVLVKNQKDEQVIKMPLLLDVRHASLTAQMNEISVEPTSEDDESDFETEERMHNNSGDLLHKEAKSIVARETEQTEIFQISFTPFKAGERELDVCLMNEPITALPKKILVLPASPKRISEIRNVEYMDSHDHSVYDEFETKDEVERQVVAQRNVWQLLEFTLVDTYGNTFPQGCDEDTGLELCLIDVHGEDLLETDGFMPCGDAEESLQTKYKVKEQGKFQLHLSIKPKTSVAPTISSTSVGLQTSVAEEKPESCYNINLLHLEVVAAMLVEDSKFDILDTFEDVDGIPTLFVDEAVKCKLDLRDERGCSYGGPFPIQNLDIYLDGDKMKLGSVKQSGGNYLFDLIYGKSGKKTLSVQLGGKVVTFECPRVFQIFGIEPYDIENCKLIYSLYEDDYRANLQYITSQEVSKGEIIGPDHSRLNNINRVLTIWDEELEEENIDDSTSDVNIYMENLNHDQATAVHRLVLSYLRGRHYRQKANEFDEQRQKWKTKSQEAWKSKNRRKAQEYSQIKTKFSSLMSKSNKMARDQIFGMYNKDRGLEGIDLHELLVADESKLEKLYQQERQRHGEERANETVNRAREEQDEAIVKLQERLRQIEETDERPQWLEVIVGAGHHSPEKQKIKPKVEEFLIEQSRTANLPMFKELNEGSLLITFQSYEGPEPCFGHYYCTTCNKSWRSQYSWVGKYQCCHRCHKNGEISQCYPMKQSELRRGGYRRRNVSTGSSIPHHRYIQKLCQKCRELGRYCGLQ